MCVGLSWSGLEGGAMVHSSELFGRSLGDQACLICCSPNPALPYPEFYRMTQQVAGPFPGSQV